MWLCSLQNGKYFGGGIKIAKDANVDDKDIDLCIAHNLNKLTVLFLLVFVRLGLTHFFKKVFFTKKVSQVEIKNSTNLLCQLDGDTKIIQENINLTKSKLINITKEKIL